MAEVEMGTLYDINKQIIGQDKILDQYELERKVDKLSDVMVESNYFALICNERHYYTVFNCKEASSSQIFSAVYDVLTSLGNVCDILPSSSNEKTYEVWIKDTISNEVFMYFMTSWDEGVIECGQDYCD